MATLNLTFLARKSPKEFFWMLDFLLPQNPSDWVIRAGATYNPMNRRIRDPYVRWCETVCDVS